MAVPEPGSDESLYLLCAEGDKEAFRSLVERYMDLLIGYFVRRLRDAELSQDLAQEVFIKLWKHAGRYTVKARFSTYLYSVAHNTLIDYMRRKKSRIDTVSADDEDGNIIAETADAGLPEPLKVLEVSEQLELVNRRLEELGEGEKQVVVLILAESLSYKEAARVLGIPEGTVKSRLHGALARLRKLLDKGDNQ
ncbi:MAG: RNA polymerase sigma factor [Planctomycetes bacterium]|nr:RNA polymerase sigma factor [Planctomycetota bacterium]